MSDETKERGRLAEEILDRLAADADFRQELLNDPTSTLAKLGYTTGEGVSGYGFSLAGAQPMGGDITTAISCGCEPGGKTGGGEPVTTWITCGQASADPPGGGGDPGTTWITCGQGSGKGSVNQ